MIVIYTFDEWCEIIFFIIDVWSRPLSWWRKIKRYIHIETDSPSEKKVLKLIFLDEDWKTVQWSCISKLSQLRRNLFLNYLLLIYERKFRVSCNFYARVKYVEYLILWISLSIFEMSNILVFSFTTHYMILSFANSGSELNGLINISVKTPFETRYIPIDMIISYFPIVW